MLTGGLIFISFPTWRIANELDASDLITRGTVLDIHAREHTTFRPFFGKSHLFVVYAFDLEAFTHDEQQFVADQRIDASACHHLHIGSDVRARLLPENLSISRMELPA